MAESRNENFFRMLTLIMNTIRATEEFVETARMGELDRMFGTILEKLNTFFKKVEESIKDFIVFEKYIACAYTREIGFSLKDIPKEVRDRVYELRDNPEVCGFTGQECICGKSIDFLKHRFTEKISALTSSGEILTKDSVRLKEGMEELGEEVEFLTGVAKKIMNIAELIEIIALNAYIEAARLGEQGRGFKVIADEVRRASVKTNELASEIVESIKSLQEKFIQQIARQKEFDESMAKLEKEQRSFSEDLNKDLLWMAENFMDFLAYTRNFVSEDMALLEHVRNTILSALQSIDLTNQRLGNVARAFSVLERMLEEFEGVLKEDRDVDAALNRVEGLYEEFRRIPKLREEREIVAKVDGMDIDKEKDTVGRKLEELETDVELF